MKKSRSIVHILSLACACLIGAGCATQPGAATAQPPNTSWPLGEYRWDGVGGTFFFVDPKDDMFAICMMQSPSQRGRIQLELKALIYQAFER